MKKLNTSSSVKELKANDLIYAKYTYNDICVFNDTILRILASSDLTGLKTSEFESIEYFARRIVNLLDSAQISDTVRSQYQARVVESLTEIKKIRPPGKNDFQTTKILYSLINWINFTNHRTRLTIEMILDDYYYHYPVSKSKVIMGNYFLKQPGLINEVGLTK